MNPKASILQLGSCSRRQCWQHFNLLRSIINSKDLNYHRHVIIDTHQLIESQQFVLFIRLYFLAFSLDNTPYKDSVNHVLRHAISQRRVLLTVFGPKVSPAQKSVGAPRGALVMVYFSRIGLLVGIKPFCEQKLNKFNYRCTKIGLFG